MRLSTAQRSAVILVDVLGYTLAELSEVAGGSILKSALQRGRARLRELASEPDAVRPPALTAFDRARLLEYAACFEARDFDAVRDMLADDVRLDLVNRLQRQGRSEVGEYFHRYAQNVDWRVVAKGDSPELTRRGGTSRRGPGSRRGAFALMLPTLVQLRQRRCLRGERTERSYNMLARCAPLNRRWRSAGRL